MPLLIGLGNPGKKYEHTRHNVGFLVVDELAKRLHAEFKNKTSFEAEVAETEEMTLMKPQTFMNVSGRSVKSFAMKKKVAPSDILVVYDDADLPFGEIRYKASGSSGGHNGMQSIIEAFPKGTAIARIRVGIGRPMHVDVPLDVFVLQKFSEEEKVKLKEVIEKAIEKIHAVIGS